MRPNTRVSVIEDNESDLDITPSALGAADPRGKPTYEEISLAAYQMYQGAGCPEGQAEHHWQEAERSLSAE